eukprot:908497-Prymnesium_polylepis.1
MAERTAELPLDASRLGAAGAVRQRAPSRWRPAPCNSGDLQRVRRQTVDRLKVFSPGTHTVLGAVLLLVHRRCKSAYTLDGIAVWVATVRSELDLGPVHTPT